MSVPTFQTLPLLWLLSDIRNDARLEAALDTLPGGSGFIFRHYHLTGDARKNRFVQLAAHARRRGHCVILSSPAELARQWGADGIYGAASTLADAPGLLRLATAHDAPEMAAANSAGANGVLLSPVFPTKSHPDAEPLGPKRFRSLAAMAEIPVIALGGMTVERAEMLGWRRWAAIDGLVPAENS